MNQGHFLNLFSIALSDSELNPLEMTFLYDLGVQRGISKPDLDFIIDNPHKIRYIPPSNLEGKVNQLQDIAKMVLADGIIDPREVKICNSIAEMMGFPKALIPNIIEVTIDAVKANKPIENIITLISNLTKNNK
jgi:hypothetical protein